MASSDAQCSNDATATARRVYLVPTELVYEGQQTYTRHDDKPPPLCDAECLFSSTELAIDVPAGLHPRTADLVRRFAYALANKLAVAEAKYGYSDNWASPEWLGECRAKLVEHVAKGDPRDVAAYAAFLWHHGERTALPAPAAVSVAHIDVDSGRLHFEPAYEQSEWDGLPEHCYAGGVIPLVIAGLAHPAPVAVASPSVVAKKNPNGDRCLSYGINDNGQAECYWPRCGCSPAPSHAVPGSRPQGNEASRREVE